MVVSSDSGESRVALTDIGVVLVCSRSVTYTNSLLVSLAEHCIPLVICNQAFVPVAWLWPLTGHHLQSKFISAQIDAPKPISKRIWKEVVKAKIRQQAVVADFVGGSSQSIFQLTKHVKSGDPSNIEAQAARKYWPKLFGKEFRRRRENGFTNSCLNYGYTVLRATAARAIVSSGLHPSVGVHHSNQFNDFRLADDLIEPYRPYIDLVTYKLVQQGRTDLDNECKQMLASTMAFDVSTCLGTTPIATSLIRLAQSVARSFCESKVKLSLPYPSTSIELLALTNG